MPPSLAPPFAWLQRPGLAGGIDNDGTRAAELLSQGWGSVEFGSVRAENLPALGARLTATQASLSTATPPTHPSAVGIGLGLDPEMPAPALRAQWCKGLQEVNSLAAAVNYVSLNLSAAANRRFLTPPLRPVLEEALHALRAYRSPIPLAVKLPVADALALAALWPPAGIDQLTVVLPDVSNASNAFDTPETLGLLAALRRATPELLRLVAVGGIRSAQDVARVRAAGADGVQVHRLFRECGAASLQQLQKIMSAFS